jgi:hypothetical protein
MEETASSIPRASSRPMPDAAAVERSTRQHTPVQSTRASRAAPGALSVARKLLCYPPCSTASPGAMKHWRDDVDRLLGMAHSGSGRSRPRSSQRQHEASASVRSPSVRAAPTKDLLVELNRRWVGEDATTSLEVPDDLRAELNRRRAGEDARVSLERARERRQNIEGRNLDYNVATVAPQTPTGARILMGVPLAGVGCAALADHLCAASWPSKFQPHLPEKYDGTSNLLEFLQVYVTAITTAGGNTAVMATYFHVALSGPVRTWPMNLAPGSVYSWEDLCARFTVNFASAYQQHGVEAHLHAVRQEPGETLRTFISRFTKVRGTIPHISDASIITAFRQGVRDEKMLEKLATHDVETDSTHFALADKCARAAEGRAWHSAPQTRTAQTGGSGVVAQDGKRRRKTTTAMRRRTPPLWSSQLRLGAGATTTSTHGRRRVTGAHALCTPMVATVPQSVARSLTLQSASARGAISPPAMAPHLIADLARRRSTTMRWLRPNQTLGISHPKEPRRMFSLETPTLVTTTRQVTRGHRIPWSTGPKPAFPRKPIWTPHESNLLMSLCRGDHSARTRTPPANSDVKRHPEMRFVTRRPCRAANGSCIVGSPGSGPSPTASTEPRRGPQSLPRLGGTLRGDRNTPARGMPALL